MSTALGEIRNWIIWNAVNGDRVTWGSDDIVTLKGRLSVSKMEHLGMLIDNNFEFKMDKLSTKIKQQARTIEKLVEALESVTNLEDPGDIELVSIEATDAFNYAREAIAEAKR